jgi:hypothetical protein
MPRKKKHEPVFTYLGMLHENQGEKTPKTEAFRKRYLNDSKGKVLARGAEYLIKNRRWILPFLGRVEKAAEKIHKQAVRKKGLDKLLAEIKRPPKHGIPAAPNEQQVHEMEMLEDWQVRSAKVHRVL